MKKTLPLLFCVLLLSVPMLVSASTLILIPPTVNPNVGRYQEQIISGRLTLDGSPVPNGLVAIEIVTPSGNALTVRTVNTGADPSTSTVTVTSAYCSDLGANPVNDVPKNTLAYFTACAYNNDVVTHSVLLIISVYDNTNSPIGKAEHLVDILARSDANATLSVPIPRWAASGRATVFAAAYSDMPADGGIPYGPEESSTFTIGGTVGQSPPVTPAGNQGNYSLPITIPMNAPLGTYTFELTSSHEGSTAFANGQFNVYQPGDFDEDGKVNSDDVGTFVDQYINYWKHLPFDPRADFDSNGKVDSDDVTLFVTAYIIYWSCQ